MVGMKVKGRYSVGEGGRERERKGVRSKNKGMSSPQDTAHSL